MFVFISMMLNFDSGVFPSALSKIQEDLNLNKYQLAITGNLLTIRPTTVLRNIFNMSLCEPYF